MHVIIVGAGQVGYQLAAQLTQEKHDISLIEKDAARCHHVQGRLDCFVLNNDGASLAALESAGIADAAALVAVTGSDEQNMIICGIAASCYPALTKIARVRNEDYVQLKISGNTALKQAVQAEKHFLGIDHFIHPDVEAARAALRTIEHGVMGDVLSFAHSEYELNSVLIQKNSPLDGLSLMDWRKKDTGESLVTLIERHEQSLLPSGGTTLQRGDRVHILAPTDEFDALYSLAGRSEKPIRSVGIAGASKIGTLIADGLGFRDTGAQTSLLAEKARSFYAFIKSFILKSSRSLVIIDHDYETCKTLSTRYPNALILNEDITDENFAAEERLGSLDLLITATTHQEINIITSLYLKSKGVKRAIALVSGSGYAVIARRLGVDVVIPATSVVVDAILSRVKGKSVKGIHTIGDGSIGIYEITVTGESPLIGQSIVNFRLKEGGLVMLVQRDKKSYIPRGDYVFQNSDTIIIIAKNNQVKQIEQYFGVQL
ncbi:MAG: Trk system potassium transport protein TrkA [Spirochaetaceae bacterium]|jgi:trk system potassium uptake protein TrkA|nr:Trk system potassium transport protein TrkA [Spirochaetaceae bacterium]